MQNTKILKRKNTNANTLIADVKGFHCFNITSQEYNFVTNLTLSHYSTTRSDGVFFINDTLYFLSGGGWISTINFTTFEDSRIYYAGDIPGGADKCMATYPNAASEEIFYFVTPGYATQGNVLYRLDTATGTENIGPNATESRFVPRCITHGDYLYIIGGTINGTFERINLTQFELYLQNSSDTIITMPEWEYVESIDYDNVICPDTGTNLEITGNPYLLNWKEYIFIVGHGTETTGNGGHIGMFNTELGELYCSNNPFPGTFAFTASAQLCAAIGGVAGQQRVYTFGGFNGGGGETDIYYTNNLSDISMSPTRIPTIIPSNQPTSTPTNIPTAPSVSPSSAPTVFSFTDNDHNHSAVVVLLINSTVLNQASSSDDSEWTDLIKAMTYASMDVRYSIQDADNDIDVEIINITDYFQVQAIIPDGGLRRRSMRRRLQQSLFAAKVIFFISLPTYRDLKLWLLERDDIIDVFEDNLKDYWGDESVSGVAILNVRTVIDYPSTTPWTYTNPDTNTTAKDGGNGGSSSGISGTFSGSDLDTLSIYTLTVLLIGGLLITIGGLIDAKYFRHNELFHAGTMILVLMYLLDVVSGRLMYAM